MKPEWMLSGSTQHISNIEGALRIINNVREVSDKIAIILDTKGPEIRTTICDTPINIKKGKTIRITGDPEKKSSPKQFM